MAKPQTAVATKKPEAPANDMLVLVQDQLPDYLQPQAGAEARGNENVSTDDIVIPRLEVVQALSPAVKDGDPAYNPAARPGMLMNSVTRQLYGKDVMVVDVFFTKQYLVWGKRKDAQGKPLEGGFFGAFGDEMSAHERVKQESNNPNLEIVDTPQHFCLLLNPESHEPEEVMVSMPRTKAKVSRQWNSLIRLAQGDRFSRVYKISTVLEKKPQGDYYNFGVAQAGFPSKGLYERAEKLYTSVAAGDRKVVMDVSDFETAEAGAGEETEM